MRLADRLGGHLVLGHVDEVGTISGWQDEGTSSLMRVSVSQEAMRYVVYKGSVCVDGVSLTISNLFDDGFEVALIPHTKQVTTLGHKRVGTHVNIEVDLLGRYIERLLTYPSTEGDINQSGLLSKTRVYLNSKFSHIISSENLHLIRDWSRCCDWDSK